MHLIVCHPSDMLYLEYESMLVRIGVYKLDLRWVWDHREKIHILPLPISWDACPCGLPMGLAWEAVIYTSDLLHDPCWFQDVTWQCYVFTYKLGLPFGLICGYASVVRIWLVSETCEYAISSCSLSTVCLVIWTLYWFMLHYSSILYIIIMY